MGTRVPDLSSLARHVVTRFAKRGVVSIDDSTSLVKSGWVDSFGIVEIVSFIESEYGIRIPDAEVTPDNFETLASIRAMLERCA